MAAGRAYSLQGEGVKGGCGSPGKPGKLIPVRQAAARSVELATIGEFAIVARQSGTTEGALRWPMTKNPAAGCKIARRSDSRRRARGAFSCTSRRSWIRSSSRKSRSRTLPSKPMGCKSRCTIVRSVATGFGISATAPRGPARPDAETVTHTYAKAGHVLCKLAIRNYLGDENGSRRAGRSPRPAMGCRPFSRSKRCLFARTQLPRRLSA